MGIWILLVVGACVGQAVMAGDFGGCNTKQIRNCIYSVAGTRDLGKSPMLNVPDTPEKLQEHCGYTEQLTNCLEKLVDKCSTEDTQLFRKEFNDTIFINTELCTEGSSLNKRFFANINCFKEHSERIKGCSVKVLENLDAAQGGETSEDELQLTCCAFHEYSECSKNSLSGCSKDAIDFMKNYFRRRLNSNIDRCINEYDIPPTMCPMNATASHNLSITLLFILLFTVTSKTFFVNSI